MTALQALGDRAFLARFESESRAAAWAVAVRDQSLLGVVEVVSAYETVAVFADPDAIDLNQLEARLTRISPRADEASTGRTITLPVLYDGEDLSEVARRLEISEPEVVALHTGATYHVFAIGFQPGYPYAGYLPERLRGLPRREPPRLRVPAGSVAIVGRQTGVYPAPSPGGWHLLGRTPLRIVDLEQAHFPIRAGDRLRFAAISQTEFESRSGELLK